MKRRISTFVRFEWNGSRYIPVEAEGFDYDGPVEEAKKGRESEEAAAKAAQDKAKKDEGTQDAARATAEPFAKSLLPNGDGSLSPYVKAQYANDLLNIHGTYGNAMRVGLRTLAQRGLGQAPTGAESSLINTQREGEAGADNDAYTNAENRTLSGGLEGLKYYQGQQINYDPNKDTQTQADAAYKRSQMGSTLGDIGSGISTLANAASTVMSGMGKMNAGQGGGGYS